MIVSNFQLFLGLPLEDDLQSLFVNLNPQLLAHYVHEDYLRKVAYKEREYLGKAVGVVSSLPQIELSEAHVRSLLRKLFPDYPCHTIPLYLFPIPYVE